MALCLRSMRSATPTPPKSSAEPLMRPRSCGSPTTSEGYWPAPWSRRAPVVCGAEAEQMIVYHFTDFAKIEAIVADGLRHDLGTSCAPPCGVVWLTRSEVPNWLLDPRQLNCRLKLFIPYG